MCSCGKRSSHAHSNIIQQHLLKPDLQLPSQVKDSSSVLMTIADASPWLYQNVLIWPPFYFHPDPWLDWWTALSGWGFCPWHAAVTSPSLSHQMFYLTAQAFIRPIYSLWATYSFTNNLCSRLHFNVNFSSSTINSSPRTKKTAVYSRFVFLQLCTQWSAACERLSGCQVVRSFRRLPFMWALHR